MIYREGYGNKKEKMWGREAGWLSKVTKGYVGGAGVFRWRGGKRKENVVDVFM